MGKREDYISKMGYRDDSPFRNAPYLNIYTPEGLIDMTHTSMPLMVDGKMLAANSGVHKVKRGVVREERMHQMPDGTWMPGATHGDYDEVELTDKEIKELRDGGYVVEELPTAQEGITVSDLNDPRLTSYIDSLDLYNLSNDFKNRVQGLVGIDATDPRDMRLLNKPFTSEQLKNSYKLPSNPNISVFGNLDKDHNPTRDLMGEAVHVEFYHPTIKPTGLYTPHQTWTKWLTGSGPDYSAFNLTYPKPKREVRYEPEIEKEEVEVADDPSQPLDPQSTWGTIIDLERSASSLAREKERDATEAKMKELKAAGLYDGPIRGRGAKDNKEWQEALAKYENKEVVSSTPKTLKKFTEPKTPEGYTLKTGYRGRDGIYYGNKYLPTTSKGKTHPVPGAPTMQDYWIKYPNERPKDKDLVSKQIGGPINNDGPLAQPQGDIYLPLDGTRPSYTDASGKERSEYKIGIGTKEGEMVIPTVWNGEQHTEDEAIDRYYNTGEHMGGPYGSIEEGERAAKLRTFIYNEHPAYRKKAYGGEYEGQLPTAQIGMEYEEKELTDFEIAKLRKGGYVVEELPMAQTGEETEPNMVHRNANWAAKVRAGLPIEFANYNDDQIRELYENQNIVGAEPYGDEMIASFQLPELEILPGRQHELPYYKDLPEHTKQIIRESNIPTPPEIIAEYGYDPWSSKHNPMLRSALWAANDGPFNLYDRLVIPAMIMQGVAKADQIYRVPQALGVEAYEAYHGRPYDFSNVNPFTETNKSNMRRPSDIMEGGKQLDKYGQEELSWSGLAADVLADPFIISGVNKLANRGIQGLTKKLVSNVSKKRYTNASKNAKFFDDFERNVGDVYNKGPEATWYDDAARTADDVSVNTKRLQSENVPAVTEPNLPTQRPERPLVRQEPTERNLWDDMQEVGLPDEFAYDPFVDPATGNTLRVNVPETGLPAAPQTNIESAWDFISGNNPSRNTLNIKSTKKGSPLEKQLNKNGEININNLKNFINKKDVPEADKFIMNKVIEDKFKGVKNINYDEFKQAISDEIVPLNTYETLRYAKVGVDPLGIYNLDDISIEEITGVKENVLSNLGLIKDKIKMLENPSDYKPKNMNDNPMSPSIITTPIGQKLHYGTDSYHEFNRHRLDLGIQERTLDDVMKRTWYPDLGMSEEMFNRGLLEDMEHYMKRIDLNKAALAKFNKPMHANNINKRQIQREKQGLKREEEKLKKLEKRIAGDVGTIKKSTSLTFENLHEFGKGSDDHFPSAPLGHARTLVTNEEPNILHILENQSDWVQHGGLEKSKKLLDPNPKKIKHLEKTAARNEETLRILKEYREKYLTYETELADLKAGVGNEAERTAWIKNNPHRPDIVHEYEIENFKQQIYDPTIRELAEYKANLKNAEQKVFLGKKLSERQLQETVAKAAKEGQTVVRIPTPETAVKIQGFTKRTLPDKAKRMEIEAEIVEIKAEMAVAKEKLDAGIITQKQYDEGMREGARYLAEAESHLAGGYDAAHQSIINKYKNGPKTVKKTFGLKTKEVTDAQGNTWYEFDIPESYINQEAEIIAFSEPATVSRSKAPKRTDPAYKGEGIYNFQDDLRAYQENKVGRKKPSYEDIDLDALDDAYNNMTDFKNAANELKRQKAIEIEDFMLDYVRAERPRMLANNKKVTKKLNEYIKRLDTKEGTERIRNQILEAPEGTPIHQMLEEQVSRMDPTLTGIEESNALNNIVDNMVNYYKGEVKKIKAMGHASTEYIRNVDNGDTRAWASRSKDGEVMEMYVGEGRLESEIDQVLEHEIGHVFGLVNNKAMKISTGIDKELSGLELVMTPDEAANAVKNNKGTKLTKDILYFKGQGQNNNTYNEATPYLAEVRQVLLDNNYIPDIYSPISKEMIKELYTEHSLFPKHNTTMGIRLFEIIKDTDKNMNIITKNINKLLGIPLAFLAGEAAAQESEETNEQPNKQMFLNPRRGKGKKNYKFKEGGAYEERELTPFEITELRARGHRVDVM